MASSPRPAAVSPEEARAAIERGALVLDVREAYRRHATSALAVPAVDAPLYGILAGEVHVPGGRPLVIVGEDGGRAAFGARVLRERGFDATALATGADGLS